MPSNREKPRILLLGCDGQFLRALFRALADQGYEPIHPQGPREEAEAFGRARPQAIVVDVAPGGDSDLLDRARAYWQEDPELTLIITCDPGSSPRPGFGRSSHRVRIFERPFSMMQFIESLDDACTGSRDGTF